MADQRKRLEKTLRGCADAGVPDTTDLWPVVKERVFAGRVGTEPAGPGESDAVPRRRSWAPQLVPNTPLGWALAAVSVLILGFGVYAAAEPAKEFYRQGLPGAVEPGSEKADQEARPADEKSDLRTEIGQTQTADGVRVTLKWAYADEKFVAVGLETRRIDGPEESEQPDPVVLQPSLWDDSVGDEAELPPYLKITDASGQDFDTVGGGTLLGPQRKGADATFDAPEGIEPGRAHRFRLEVPLVEEPMRVGDRVSGKPEPGPFVFDFEIPVRPAPTIELNQKAEAEGVTLTLERVVASPLAPQAVVCFEPPDDRHDWMPFLRYDEDADDGVGSAPQELGDGCWSLGMTAPVDGRSSVTVTNLEGMPTGPPDPEQTVINPKTIHGPWTFEFEAPAP